MSVEKKKYGIVTDRQGKVWDFTQNEEMKYKIGWIQGFLMSQAMNSIICERKERVRASFGGLMEALEDLSGDCDGFVNDDQYILKLRSEMIGINRMFDECLDDLKMIYEALNYCHLEMEGRDPNE
jgi:hypothetical protein